MIVYIFRNPFGQIKRFMTHLPDRLFLLYDIVKHIKTREMTVKFALIGQIRADLTGDRWPEKIEDLIKEEQTLAAKYYEDGYVERAWSMTDRPGAVAIYNVNDRQELESLLERFPLFQAGYVDAQIIELRSYDGFDADR